MKYRSSIIKSILSLAILAALILIVQKSPLSHNLTIHSIVKGISRKRKYDELYFLLLYTLKPILVVVPATVVSVAGGILFGPVKGFIMNMIGFFLSGTLAFYLSRLLGKDLIDKIIRGKALEVDKALEKKGFKVAFLLRLPPIFPYDIVSFTAGLTKMKYKDFIAGSVLGVIPETICYSYVGKRLGEPLTYKLILPFAAIILVTVITIYIFNKSRHIIEVSKEN